MLRIARYHLTTARTTKAESLRPHGRHYCHYHHHHHHHYYYYDWHHHYDCCCYYYYYYYYHAGRHQPPRLRV